MCHRAGYNRPDVPSGRWLVGGGGRVSWDIGGMPVYRRPGRGGGLRRGGPGPEQVPLDALAAAGICAGIAAVAGQTVTHGAGGVGAGGLALVEQVVTVVADRGGLPAGAAGSAPARAGQQQAQPEQGQRADHDAVEEKRAGGAGHVVAEDREVVGERMPAAAIGQHAGYSGDHRRDQDDEPDNDDHDVLRGSELLTDAGGPWRPPPCRFPGGLDPARLGGPARPCRLREHLAGGAQRCANRRELLDRPLIRWKMSSRTAAPTMAVSQVDRLKNPCRVWTWNSSVAAQPPPSAPRTPITQVRMRPCDLLPGISILASRPAPRPRTIHAMMPITDSLSQ